MDREYTFISYKMDHRTAQLLPSTLKLTTFAFQRCIFGAPRNLYRWIRLWIHCKFPLKISLNIRLSTYHQFHPFQSVAHLSTSFWHWIPLRFWRLSFPQCILRAIETPSWTPFHNHRYKLCVRDIDWWSRSVMRVEIENDRCRRLFAFRRGRPKGGTRRNCNPFLVRGTSIWHVDASM